MSTIQCYCDQDALKVEMFFLWYYFLERLLSQTLTTTQGSIPLFLEIVVSAMLPYIANTALLTHSFHLIM